MKVCSLFCILLICFSACKEGQTTSISSPKEKRTVASNNDLTEETIGVDTIKGYLLPKEGYADFMTCGSDKVVKVYDRQLLVGSIIDGITTIPFDGEKFYGELFVDNIMSTDNSTGTETMYYSVKEIIKISERGFRENCQKNELWAYDLSGEFAWQLQVSKEEGIIVFKDKKEEVAYLFNYSEKEFSKQNMIFESNDTKGNKITITAKQNLCKTIPDDRDFNYDVTITLNEREFNGCGVF